MLSPLHLWGGICLSVIGQETHPHGYQVVKVQLGLLLSMFLASHPLSITTHFERTNRSRPKGTRILSSWGAQPLYPQKASSPYVLRLQVL